MMKVTLLAMAVILAGCSSAPKYNFTVDAATNKMPEAVRQKCEPIPKELEHGAAMGNQTVAFDNLIGLYGVCAERDAAKADWISSQGQ
ncbi:hypothetical protein D3C76_388880 [compost metagenome]